MLCRVCEALKEQIKYQQKWIDRMMEERHPDPNSQPKEETPIEVIDPPSDDLSGEEKFGEG